jgi:XTP/dITP diphosphohydrolase
MTEMGLPDRTLVLASGNPGKLRELKAMLDPLGWVVMPQSDWAISEADEDGLSFIENALIKARHASKYTGLPALGDDSGLVVDALNGAPGIFSSRFGGANADDISNNNKLLSALEGVPKSARSAHFYCAMALVRHAQDPSPLLATGRWDGQIMKIPAGGGGFGYDPLFWVPEKGCSSAELPEQIKNRFSHRGKALSEMMVQMDSL